MGWEMDVLQALSAPASDNNVKALQLWAQSEGTPPEWNNPLATTMDGHGGNAQNSAGVKAYPDEASGVAATVDTLQLGYYVSVVQALRDDAGLEAIWQAVNASPWCSGCQDGKYPVALHDAIQAQPSGPDRSGETVPWLKHVSDVVARSDGSGYVLGRYDGGIGCFHGAPFYGSVPELPDSDRLDEPTEFVALVLHANQDAYTIFDRQGHGFAFPVGAAPVPWPFDVPADQYDATTRH